MTSEKKVVEEIKFVRPRPQRKDVLPDLPEPAPVSDDPEFEQFAAGFQRLRAPADGGMPAINVEMFGYHRIARSMYDQGYRLHPELATKKWTPTPGLGVNSSYDGGKFFDRNSDGSWPVESIEAELDLDDIQVDLMPTGEWGAVHGPSQVAATGATKVEATRKLMDELEDLFTSRVNYEDPPAE